MHETAGMTTRSALNKRSPGRQPNAIDRKFAELRERGEAALIPFVTAGDPDLKTTGAILRALEAAGADCIEVGVPFSDPTADGPTIQRSSERALNKGVSLPAILRLIADFRRDSDLPLILFGYYNPFFHFGLPEFCRAAARAGVNGVLCVDLPPEESAELQTWTDSYGLNIIFLLSPTSNDHRIRLVGQHGRGFIYYVSVTGVTGARRTVDDDLAAQVGRVKRMTSLPVGVGFGVSTPQQAAHIARFADAVIVGSALVDVIDKARGQAERAKRAAAFVASLKEAIRLVNKPPKCSPPARRRRSSRA
jgi:tryptophan synthase alpha chain